MRSLFLSVAMFAGAGFTASAQQLATVSTPAPAGPPAANYEDVLSCAMHYQLHAGEAEMQGLKAARKARFGSSDKALEQATKLAEPAGKSTSAVEDELTAKLDKLLASPPSRAALSATAKRCDVLLALTTP